MVRTMRLVVAVAFAMCTSALAQNPPTPVPPALRLTDGTNTVQIDSTGAVWMSPGCACSSSGPVTPSTSTLTWSGQVGAFTVTALTGRTKGALPQPSIDLGVGELDSSDATKTLSISWTDVGFTLMPPFTFTDSQSIYGVATPTFSVFVDSSNAPFGTGTPVGSITTTLPTLSQMSSPSISAGLYSMTETESITIGSESYVNDFGFNATVVPAGGGSQNPPPTTPLVHGDAATIGFWHNKNGQALIKSLNGSATATNLATWLALSFPNLYGPASSHNLTGKNNTDVANLFLTLFSVTGQKTYAQILAGALAEYVTSSGFAGTAASKYGFNVSAVGTGGKTVTISSSDAAAIGLTGVTSVTVSQLLAQASADAGAPGGMSTAAFNAFNNIFSNINQTGDIT